MRLTPREREVLDALVRVGRKELARTIGVSEKTVKSYLHKLYIKFDIEEGHKDVKLAVEWYYRNNPEKRI